MSCYSNSANGSQTKDGSIATEKKWEANGTLTEELISLFKSEAQKNSLDWRWLAALSYVESNWRTNIRNSYGYYGLFQFIDSTLNDGVKAGQRRYSLTSPKDQTEVAARNMARRKGFAATKDMNEEDSYLYASMAHNCGDGGAQFLLGKASPKTVYNMVQVEKNLPAGEFRYKFMSSSAKRKEISEYPYKVKSAYKSICTKYQQ